MYQLACAAGRGDWPKLGEKESEVRVIFEKQDISYVVLFCTGTFVEFTYLRKTQNLFLLWRQSQENSRDLNRISKLVYLNQEHVHG